MDLQKMIMDNIQDKLVADMSKKTGLSSETTKKAMGIALPMLMGGISKNADTDSGKQSIDTALDSHDEVYSLEEEKGGQILGHIFGGDEEKAEEALAVKSGVTKTEATGVMKLLAPFVMGQLGAAKKSGTDVAGELQKDTLAKSLLIKFLDKDNDGDIKDDLLSMGMDYMKKKFM